MARLFGADECNTMMNDGGGGGGGATGVQAIERP